MKKLSLKDVEYLSFQLAQEKLGFHEPIPSFTTRFPGVLEACLEAPWQSYDKKPLYKGMIGKAAILFYLLIKNHPFQNGNKRIAMTSLFVFLYMNKKWIKVSNQELYNFAVWVASSPAAVKKDTVEAIETFLRKYLVNL
ncbi:type II toxin-antitoxin system death-on-curing family toxin [Patescibacteria group bacterium]